MTSKLIFHIAFHSSILFFLLTVIYDSEIMFMTITFLLGHILKGFFSVISDYIYSKTLKLLLLFYLQLIGIGVFQQTLCFWF